MIVNQLFADKIVSLYCTGDVGNMGLLTSSLDKRLSFDAGTRDDPQSYSKCYYRVLSAYTIPIERNLSLSAQ